MGVRVRAGCARGEARLTSQNPGYAGMRCREE